MNLYEKLENNLKNKQYKWLVTGVGGFIGSNILEKLLILNQKIVGLDNFERGYKQNINQAISDANKTTAKNLNNNFEFIDGDIRNLEDCKKACEGVDYVLHQAALGSVARSIEDPISTTNSNINGFLNILKASNDASVKKFIYASSSSVYGDHESLPKKEDIIGNPLSPYAITKRANELYAQNFSKLFNINTIGLRYFNVFGKRQDPKGDYAAVIPKWIDSIVNSKPIIINGDGKTSRDFCYIENVVQINILAAFQTSKNKYEVYNVAYGQQTSLNDLIDIIKSAVSQINLDYEKSSPIIYKDFRKGDVRHSLADITKAKNILKYVPSIDVRNGLKLYIEWFLNDKKTERINT